MKPRCVILGAGGHALVLADCLRAVRQPIGGVVVPPREHRGGTWNGIRILGGDDVLASLPKRGITHFAVGLAGDLDLREALFERARESGLQPLTVIHPTAIVSRLARILAGAQVFPGAILNAGVHVGFNAVVNTGAILDHECEVGDHAHVATGARLAGSVRVGRRAFVGAGATVKDEVQIGERAVVGMGAAVVRDVKPGQVVAGVPAKPL